MDKADIHDGNWLLRIDEALLASEWLVLVMTPESLASPAVRHEVSVAISRTWNHQMRGVLPIVMITVQPETIPPTWDILQRFDAVREGYCAALAKLCIALNIALPTAAGAASASPSSTATTWPALERALGLTLPARLKSDEMRFSPLITRAGQAVLIPPTVEVLAGWFWMGTQGNKEDEPLHQITLGAYRIGIYPVTVAEYACAIKAGAVREPPKKNIRRKDVAGTIAPAGL